MRTNDSLSRDSVSEANISRHISTNPKSKSTYDLLCEIPDSYPVFIESILDYIEDYPEDESELLQYIKSGKRTASDVIRFNCLMDEKHHVNDGYYL